MGQLNILLLHGFDDRGSLQQVLEEFGPDGRRAVKGEVVLLVSGCSADEQQYFALATAAAGAPAGISSIAVTPDSKEVMLQQLVLKELAAGKSVSATAKALSQQLQLPRSKVYKLALELAAQQTSSREVVVSDG